ncbi:hypothetical protein [Aeoliella sp.]|uniref:hypothetical protein n=1 Tax=Aeoliella sp. TaxID=2795800 RepID=UPI003CCBEACE
MSGRVSIVVILLAGVAWFCRTAGAASPEALPDLQQLAKDLSAEDLTPLQRARIHGRQASAAWIRCHRYLHGWLAQADEKTGLIPQNLRQGKDIWNGRNSAADNYAFMVLVAAFTDQPIYRSRMLDMLRTEQQLTSRVGALPDAYSFSKQGFAHDEIDMDRVVFDGSEYVKDGLMPITELLGSTPWTERMVAIVDSILEHGTQSTPHGVVPSDSIEVNGEMMQVMSRLYYLTDDQRYLDGACRIADYYLLGDRHPTRDVEVIQLRDHNCELISGLTEVYCACHFDRPEKKASYQAPLHRLLDDLLAHGINEHGLMYDSVNMKTGEVVNARIHDSWGYNFNGVYTVYLLDGTQSYREATRKALGCLKPHYWSFAWQGKSADGIADSVEGAINLMNREPDVAGLPEWVDANIERMLAIQQPSGIVEGWHGDGNYARTAMMWALWKQQGATVQPWRGDVSVGAAAQGDGLVLSVQSSGPWKGRLCFDPPRHREVMRMPLDYPRINQFPVWFTVASDKHYAVVRRGDDGEPVSTVYPGSELIAGLELDLTNSQSTALLVIPVAGANHNLLPDALQKAAHQLR